MLFPAATESDPALTDSATVPATAALPHHVPLAAQTRGGLVESIH